MARKYLDAADFLNLVDYNKDSLDVRRVQNLIDTLELQINDRVAGIMAGLETQLSTTEAALTTLSNKVETAKQHLDASQLLRRARRLDPQIDRVTVYRTLGLLKRHGLIDELDLMHMQGEKHFYERRPQRDHIHMACLRCGKITEFESDLFDRLKGQIQRDCRFHIVVTRLEVGGYCAQCRTTDQAKD